jgi:hypothetical protein
MANMCTPCTDEKMIKRYEKGELTGLCAQCVPYTFDLIIKQAHAELKHQADRNEEATRRNLR